MAVSVQVICPENEVEYFCKDEWTGQISLIRQEKLDFRRKAMNSGSPVLSGQTRHPDQPLPSHSP
jgi:hypothetical protein